MKTLTLLLSLIFLTLGCAPDRVHVETERYPFIVNKIEKYSETHSIYYSEEFTTWNMWALDRPEIVLPTGYMSIGDTLKVVNQNEQR